MFAIAVEILWLIFIAAFAACCAYPLYHLIAHDFVIVIIVLAMLFAFYFRLVVFFRQTAWLNFLAAQILLFLVNIALFIMVLNTFQDMTLLFNEYDILYFMVPGSNAGIYEMNDAFHLFKKEFLLIAVGLLIVLSLTEFRIAMSLVKRIREME